MGRLEPLSAERLAIAEARLRNPLPGSRMEAARDQGVDLTLILAQLRLTPAQRVAQMHDICAVAEQVRGAARRNRP